MNTKSRNNIGNAIAVVILIAFAYHFRAEIPKGYNIAKEYFFPTPPCSKTIYYSFGAFDKRFGISQDQFSKIVAIAASAWNRAWLNGDGHINLLQYAPDGPLKIDLSYDYRQQATEKLNQIGGTIDAGKSAYNTLQSKYDSLTYSYNKAQNELNAAIAKYNSDKASYEQQVSYWNSRGGAPADQFQALENKRNAINNEADAINAQKTKLNELVNTINQTGTTLNDMAKDLNMNVANYNNVGATTGEQFNEGIYREDANGKTIIIYQYDDTVRLKRVLEHEFGHAIGLEHVDDKDAIMYYLNNSNNQSLTSADLDELERVCTAKSQN